MELSELTLVLALENAARSAVPGKERKAQKAPVVLPKTPDTGLNHACSMLPTHLPWVSMSHEPAVLVTAGKATHVFKLLIGKSNQNQGTLNSAGTK